MAVNKAVAMVLRDIFGLEILSNKMLMSGASDELDLKEKIPGVQLDLIQLDIRRIVHEMLFDISKEGKNDTCDLVSFPAHGYWLWRGKADGSGAFL